MKLIKQFDETDCGAACLSMIANHYGYHISVTDVRNRAGTDRLGTNLYGLISAASELNLSAKALFSESKKISRNLPVPFIMHINKENTTLHYIVVYKITNKFVYVADPEDRKKRIPVSTLESSWTGYAIFISLTPEFKYNKENRFKLFSYLSLLKPHIKVILLSIIASLM